MNVVRKLTVYQQTEEYGNVNIGVFLTGAEAHKLCLERRKETTDPVFYASSFFEVEVTK